MTWIKPCCRRCRETGCSTSFTTLAKLRRVNMISVREMAAAAPKIRGFAGVNILNILSQHDMNLRALRNPSLGQSEFIPVHRQFLS